MRTLKILAFAVIAVGALGCEPGQLFGPNTARVTVLVTKLVSDDKFVVYINGSPHQPALTDSLPSHRYRPEIQTLESSRRSNGNVESGEVFVSVWSVKLGLMSRVKSQWAYTDRIAEFEFRISDFIVR